jgi:TetR/AcrR family transcriptional regulator, transcriptional repressor of bet genes
VSRVANGSVAEAQGVRRGSRLRQRQRLIDACISALHIHGPSSTTVEKVVAIAGMSPGIVRFYFDSKAAMMVASLQFLAAEFEEQLLVPVAALRAEPVRALELLVDLYLGPEIASPRKVSVWYAFWGEANSRQEYFDICGQKDERFAALVRDLIGRLVVERATRHLDADAIALGLIGVLEVLWQDFAFQNELNIDRAAARRRTMSYLRSVFPGAFPERARIEAPPPAVAQAPGLPALAYQNEELRRRELALYAGATSCLGFLAELERPGSFLSGEALGTRVLVINTGNDLLALENRCGHRAHALVSARRGELGRTLRCPVHGLEYRADGTAVEAALPPLARFSVASDGGLVLIGPAGVAVPQLAPPGFAAPRLVGPASERTVEANWKLLAEQWLECAFDEQARSQLAGLCLPGRLALAADGRASLTAPLAATGRGFSAALYLARVRGEWLRVFLPPRQLIDFRPDGATVLTLEPQAAQRTRVVVRHASADGEAHAAAYLARRLYRRWLLEDAEVAEAAQRELAAGRRPSEAPPAAAVATLQDRIRPLLAGLEQGLR